MTGTFRLDAPGGRRIAIPPVIPSDDRIDIWGHAVTSTTCARLTPEQARALGQHLQVCADLIDPRPPQNGA